ncbi:multicopper oxidase family protein [Streptomyces sp. CBMA156]|uniref:multicopper oxidase family protein n=1 Tax=Streptomyces sp. CBMA156 TaxID=1930280 RepID=UPI0016621BD5|nr:multicopper oxidase family protein [Streptomyces sp. CBMA156]MBD0669336.1 bilirubin oxidase [Streptomyces sp. CBMA156]
MVTRRRMIGAALATGGGVLLLRTTQHPAASATATAASAGDGAHTHPAGTDADPGPDAGPALAQKFTTALPLPPVLSPVATDNGADTYTMTMLRSFARILPGRRTDVLTYNGAFPGPVIRARSGRPVIVRQTNLLDDPVSVHLHGSSVPPDSDGGPMNLLDAGATRTYTYPNAQPHASLWFHDHAHHLESEHVYRGLAGTYLLTDATEAALPLPSGRYDLPIALRDARFDTAGNLVYRMDDAEGRATILANGRPWPRVDVAARRYRIRLLNSSNLRFFSLRLADGGPITQIGSDGGLLERPHTTDTVDLSPGERADVVIDFSRYRPGTGVVLTNSMPPGPAEHVGQVLRFDVGRPAPDPSAVPDRLRTLAPPGPAVRERTIVLKVETGGGLAPRGLIDGKAYDPARVDASVAFGTSEIWTVVNANTDIPHNFHLHLVQFRVLARNGAAPGPGEAGLKDTVRLMPGESVRLQAVFDSYRGRYPYHCHLLDHSAMGMMAQLEIT